MNVKVSFHHLLLRLNVLDNTLVIDNVGIEIELGRIWEDVVSVVFKINYVDTVVPFTVM